MEKSSWAWLTVCLLAGLTITTAKDLPTISAVGNKFFSADGNQFLIKGIAYQLTSDDPLTDTEQCKRDARLMSTLRTNTIRVYHVDPKADHTGCMAAFADAGIYAVIDLDTFDTYIEVPLDESVDDVDVDVVASAAWTPHQFGAYAAVMDEFHNFTNTLAFFVGNENIARTDQSALAPAIKAAAHDMKAYRDARGYRTIPIGYSAADIAELRPMLQDYLTCGGDAAAAVDFFSLNSYQWCDPSSYRTSGYANLNAMAAKFPVPIFLSETGCNTPGPRLFEDQAAVFGPDMVSMWSGAIIYEWIQEANNYGLIQYGPKAVEVATADADDSNVDADGVVDGFTRRGEPTPILPDFENLQAQWAKATPVPLKRDAYHPDLADLSTRACPAATPGGWAINGDVALPTLDAAVLADGPNQTMTATTGRGGGGIVSEPTATPQPTDADSSNAMPHMGDMSGLVAAGVGLVGVMFVFTVWL